MRENTPILRASSFNMARGCEVGEPLGLPLGKRLRLGGVAESGVTALGPRAG